MSLESAIEKLTAAVEANTAALLAAGTTAAAAPAPAAEKPKAEKPAAEKPKAEKPAAEKKAEKAKAEKPAATKPAVDDGFGDTDEFGDSDLDSEEAASDTPKYTPQDAKAAALALRDAAAALKDADHGKRVAKAALAEAGITSLNDIPEGKADELVAACQNHAVIAKCIDGFRKLARAAGVAL